MCLSMTNTCHLGSSPLFPRGDLRGVSTVESTLAGPPCSPPLEKGGRAESLPVQFLHTFPPVQGNHFYLLRALFLRKIISVNPRPFLRLITSFEQKIPAGFLGDHFGARVDLFLRRLALLGVRQTGRDSFPRSRLKVLIFVGFSKGFDGTGLQKLGPQFSK